MQLTHATEYQAVYAGVCGSRQSVTKGPLRVSSLAQPSTPSRLGLSVPGRVGTNVKRNRIKRLIREAFRLNYEKIPTGFDFVVGVHPHQEKSLEEYTTVLLDAMQALAKKARAEG